MSKHQYVASGLEHTKSDIEIQPHQIKKIQKTVNDHVFWLNEMIGCGSNWNQEDRMAKNLLDEGEQVCLMTLLVKDHKDWSPKSGKPPPSRPVVSGN